MESKHRHVMESDHRHVRDFDHLQNGPLSDIPGMLKSHTVIVHQILRLIKLRERLLAISLHEL